MDLGSFPKNLFYHLESQSNQRLGLFCCAKQYTLWPTVFTFIKTAIANKIVLHIFTAITINIK